MAIAQGLVTLTLGATLGLTLVANGIFASRLGRSLNQAPRLAPLPEPLPPLPKVTVIIPAYNEAVNIAACAAAVLASELPDPQQLQVIVADDESQDDTAAIAQALADSDPRLQVFTVPPRPQDTLWQGKNWACAQAVERATGDYWLFIDADVRLQPTAIAQALADAQQSQADLLSCAPLIRCGCLAEWLAQPIIMSLIAVGFDFAPVNDPQQPTVAFAAGPFMLFRRTAYEAIGGHRAIAPIALEDVTLARRIKAAGLRLRYVLSGPPVQVRMYQDFAGLWEGWTKNFHLGANRNIGATLFGSLAVLLIYVFPWLLALGAGGWFLTTGTGLGGAIAALLTLGIHLYLRLDWAERLLVPPRYWWLGGLGGLMVSAIALVSMIKVETGWGWTWRGRPLANAPEISNP